MKMMLKMMAPIVALLLVTYSGITSSMSIHEPVDIINPAYRPMSLLDAVASDSNARYHNKEKGFTAIKDSNYKSCFITSYDPQWHLELNEKQYIVDHQQSRYIITPGQLSNFEDTVGEVIASMCKKMNIFWIQVSSLSRRLNFPLSSAGKGTPLDNTRSNNGGNIKTPPPLQSSHHIRTPPPLLGRSPIRTPPPLPGLRHRIKTPPPLSMDGLAQAYQGNEIHNVQSPNMVPHSAAKDLGQSSPVKKPTISEGIRRKPSYPIPHKLPVIVMPHLRNVLPNLPGQNTKRGNLYPVPVKNDQIIVPKLRDT